MVRLLVTFLCVILSVSNVLAIATLDATKPLDSALMSTYGATVRETRTTLNEVIAALTLTGGAGAQYYLPYWNSTTTLGTLASKGSVGSILMSAGSAAPPAWTTYYLTGTGGETYNLDTLFVTSSIDDNATAIRRTGGSATKVPSTNALYDYGNNIRVASLFNGANAGEKIAAAIANLPATGGTIDARGLEGAQIIAQDLFSGVTTPVTLVLGAATYTVSESQTITASGMAIVSEGGPYATTWNYTKAGSGHAFDIGNDSTSVYSFRAEGLWVNSTGGSTGNIFHVYPGPSGGTFNVSFRNMRHTASTGTVYTFGKTVQSKIDDIYIGGSGIQSHGIELYNECDAFIITNSSIRGGRDSGKYGIKIESGGGNSGILIEGNVITDFDIGIVAGTTQAELRNLTIADNYFEYQMTKDILLGASSYTVRTPVVRSNYFYGAWYGSGAGPATVAVHAVNVDKLSCKNNVSLGHTTRFMTVDAGTDIDVSGNSWDKIVADAGYMLTADSVTGCWDDGIGGYYCSNKPSYGTEVYTSITLDISTVAGNAFISNVSGSIPFNKSIGRRITISDGSHAVSGYIKALGTGETFGSDLMTNGGMETGDPPTNWTAYGTSVLSQQADPRTGSAGSYCVQATINNAGSTNTAYSYIMAATSGKLYKAVGWMKNVDATSIAYMIPLYGTNITSETVSDTSWTEKTTYFTSDTTSLRVRLLITGEGKIGKWDDITLKEVLTPSATGVTISDSSGGTTYSWATNTGLNVNAASYTVTIYGTENIDAVDGNFTGTFSAGAAAFTVDATGIVAAPNLETRLSSTTIDFSADGNTTIYTVPTDKRCVLTKAIVIASADAGTTTLTIGQAGALTDFVPVNTLSNLDAQYDSAVLMPTMAVAYTPEKQKSYTAGTVIKAVVGSHAGAAGNTIVLFGYLY